MSELKPVAWQHPLDLALYNTATTFPHSRDDVPLVLLSDAQAEIDRLKAECEALRKDAERWRFFRRATEDDSIGMMLNQINMHPATPEEADATIDAAIAKDSTL